jgi:transposase
MQSTDMRSLSRDARHERRVQVIRLRNQGLTYDQIASFTGLSRTGVFNICKRYQVGGEQALRDATGGRRIGEKRRLSPEQEQSIFRTISEETPNQHRLPFEQWSRPAVLQLIRQLYGIDLPVRTMGLYLSRWGFKPQKHRRVSYVLRA